MDKRIILLVLSVILVTGCDLNVNSECETGFHLEDNKCVKIDEQKAIHKKEEFCMDGTEIDGQCYISGTKNSTSPIKEEDMETGEITTSCPQGYRLNDAETSCEAISNGMTPKEYWECPDGYTFDESGVKSDDSEETSGLKDTCYKRIEEEVKKD